MLIKILLIVLGVIIVIGMIVVVMSSTPISKEQAITVIQSITDKQLNNKHVSNVIITVDSGKYEFHQTFTAGSLDGYPITDEQPFHVASVGKAFTATLIGCLLDDGAIFLNDKITNYLEDELLDGLFVVGGKDYRHEVTIAQLLNHTSGIAGFFDDEAKGIENMQTLIHQQKDKFWTPKELVRYTADYQTPIGVPGEVHHYSDTGYILLGLITENVSGQTFDTMLKERIFNPLGMDDSYLMLYSEPKNEMRPIADVWLSGVNAKDYTSLSIDWAAGGIISTTSDLTKFVRALNNGKIISTDTLEQLYTFDHKYMRGIHYGHGFMEYHFEEFSPTMKSIPNYVGHMGVLGTQMFYDKTTDTVYISSFGSADATSASVKAMIKVISILMRIK